MSVYTLGKQKQLIDLNGDSVNFNLNFFCESLDGSEFDVLVVDQQTLDSNPNGLTYKRAQGKISGNISSDKNIYQNYFLILKSDNECQVKVTTKKQVLPHNQNPQGQGQPQGPQGPHTPQGPQGPPQVKERFQPPHPQPQPQEMTHGKNVGGGGINFKMILIVVVIAGGLFFLFKSKKSDVGVVPKESNFETVEPQLSLNSPSPSSSVSSPSVEAPKMTSSLLSKLEKISGMG